MTESPVLTFNDLYRKHCSEELHTRFFELWHYTSADGLLGIIRNEPNEIGKQNFCQKRRNTYKNQRQNRLNFCFHRSSPRDIPPLC